MISPVPRARSVVFALLLLASCRHASDAGVSGTGTIEIVEIDIAPLAPARVVRVIKDEGDAVRIGDTVALLTQATLRADIESRGARVAAASARLRDLEAGARPAEVQRAESEVRTAEAEVTRTAADLQRLTGLAASQIISQQQLDAARTAASTAASRRDAARDALRLVRDGARPQQIAAARAEVAGERASLSGAVSVASDLVLISPVAGVVTSRNAEPGEVLTAGQSAVTVGDVARPWVRIYVDERALPLVRVGQRAIATLDAYPKREFRGRVAAIASKAEFTPRVALTESERADLLFGVKVELADSTGMLKAGLPVTVRVITDTAGTSPPRVP